MSTPHPDPELLALAALPAEPPDPVLAAHLRECRQCRAQLDELRHTVELAVQNGVGETLPAPPPGVWRAVVDELAVDELPGDELPGDELPGDELPGDEPGAAPQTGGPAGAAPTSGRRFPRRGALVGIAAAAAAVGLAAGLGIGLGVGNEPPPAPEPTPVVRLSPVGFADPAATGTATMVDSNGDRRMVVQLTGVTNLAGGDYLEAWLMDSSGTRLLPLGALARHGEEFRGDFTVPAGLSVTEFDRVDVSAERFDGDPGHSTVSLLRGTLA
jgi:Anti-sigma-K factor rskA